MVRTQHSRSAAALLLALLSCPLAGATAPAPTPAPPTTSPSVAPLPPLRRARTAARFESPPASQPTPRTPVPFDPQLFSYDRRQLPPARWATPLPEQITVYGRPPTTRPTFDASAPDAPIPAPARYINADLRWFEFLGDGNEPVTGLLATPTGKPGPFPLVLLTHGLLSHKMQVFSQIGDELVQRGFAVVAIDLPLHGERPGIPLEILNSKDPRRMSALWRRAVVDLRQTLDLTLDLPLIDRKTPVIAVGYSLGSWMSVIAGAADDRIGALTLMVGGATDLPADLLAFPAFASSDPRTAIAAFSPRPVLMVNARSDRTVTPEMADRLYNAARDPKERRWYDMGHILKQPAYSETADWIAAHALPPPPPPTPRP